MRGIEIGLKKKVVSGAFWLTSLTFLGQIFTWSVTLIVIRLLQPEDYGLMAMATVFLGILMIFNEIGFGPAIIQKQEVGGLELKKAAGCLIIINIGLFCFLVATAPLVGRFFSEPRVSPVIRVLSINFIFISFYSVPHAKLQRELRFRTKAIIDLLGNLVLSATVLTLAISGFGYWALVFGQVGKHAFKAVIFNIPRNLRYSPSFSLKGMRDIINFGAVVSLNRLLWYFYSQADIIIGGRILGKQLLGVYSVAMQLVTIPLNKVSPLISQIGFPAFSRIQYDLQSVQSNFMRLVRLVNTFSFPVFAGLAMLAPDAVPLLLGPKWKGVVFPIQLLSLVMPLRLIGALFAPVVVGKGRPEVITGNMLFGIVIMPIAFIVGSNWGIIGLCYAWVGTYPLLFLIMSKRVCRVLHLPIRSLLGTIAMPLIGSSIMALGLFASKRQMSVLIPPVWLVVLLVCIGIALYFFTTLLINKNAISEIRSVFTTT